MIDVHIHAVHDHIPGGKPAPGHEDALLDEPPDVVAAHLRKEMAAAGITTVLGMGRLDAPADDPLGINGTLRIASLLPGLRAIGIADPNKTVAADAGHFKRAEADIAAGKVVALKGYTGYLHFSPDSPGYHPYYRLAAKFDIPFIFHTGDTWSTTAKVRFAHPLLVDDVAVDFPDVKFVIAHMGNPWLKDAAEVIFKNDNVWADLSGLFVGDETALKTLPDGTLPPNTYLADLAADLQRAFRYTEKPERFLYGSDWPLVPMAAYRNLIAAMIPKAHHEKVFETNARALFKLG